MGNQKLPLFKRLGQKFATEVKRPLGNQRGVAMIVAISAVMLIMYFAMEVTYDSNVEYLVNSQGINRIKAYYAAKSGLQLSLLRIKIYQQAQSQFGQQLGNSTLLDQIWSFPFAWPLPMGEELNAVDRDAFKKIFKESSMDASYVTSISDEGSKIDINDLASPSKVLQEATKTQILNIFQQKLKDDEEFNKAHSNVRFDELVNVIADWLSDKNTSANGGDKKAAYAQLNSDVGSDYFPPNRPFRSIAELHLIPGMTDEFFDLLAPKITVFGMKGINPNLASKEVLKSLDPGITEEIALAAITRRDSEQEGGPFKCEAEGGSSDFWGFVQSKGARLMSDYQKIPMNCDTATNFRILSTGAFAGATREIEVVVMNFEKTAEKIKSYTDKEKQQENPNPSSAQKPKETTSKTPQTLKGPPRIVYWNER